MRERLGAEDLVVLLVVTRSSQIVFFLMLCIRVYSEVQLEKLFASLNLETQIY